MNRKALTAVLSMATLLCPAARANAPTPLPRDTIWYTCTGYGVRTVNRTMSETTPDTNTQPNVYAASLSMKKMWWYWEPQHQLRDYTTTEIAGDRITVTQHHDMSPRYIADGMFSLDRSRLTYTSSGSAAYPDGTRQVVHGSGTCKTIAARPVE